MTLPPKKFEKIVPDAFHGTDLETAEAIVSEKKFTPSIGDEHYLGDGIYFFESSLGHAKDWARRKVKKAGSDRIGVVKARIELRRCLDLNDFDNRKYIRSVVGELVSRGVSPITDGVVINMIAKKAGIDTVRANYVVPDMGKIFDESRFFDYSCLMISVRNPDCISEISTAFMGVVI